MGYDTEQEAEGIPEKESKIEPNLKELDELKGQQEPSSDLGWSKHELQGRTPSLCEGSSAFWCYFTSCCGLGILFPTCILIPLAFTLSTSSSTLRTVLLSVAGGLIGCAIFYFLFSIRAVLQSGLPCTLPRAPPLCSSFIASGPACQQAVRRLYIVANMTAGTGLGSRIVNDVVLPMCKAASVEAIVLPTKYAGHAMDYARLVPLANIDGFVIVGGDGSFFEVANGLLRRADGQRVPLGLLPGGSGNSILADLGTWSAREAMQRILDGKAYSMDALRIRDQGTLDLYSVNTASVGLIGDIGYTAEACRCLGPARYDICGLWGLAKGIRQRVHLRYRAPSTSTLVTLDMRMITCFANQTQYFGKGHRSTPKARLDDGLMDMIFVDTSRGQLLSLFNQIPTGSHVDSTSLSYFHTSEAWITVDPTSDQLLALNAPNETENKDATQEGKDPDSPPTGSRQRDMKYHEGLMNIDGEMVPYTGTLHLRMYPSAIQVFTRPDAVCVDPKGTTVTT